MQLKSDILPILRVLANQRYGLDMYQRGYVWSDRELTHFLTDLEDYAIDWAGDPSAPPWFMGSVIIERRADRSFLVDGQQRLVTFSLLLLALHDYADRAGRRDIELALGGGSGGLSLPIAVGRYQTVFAALAGGTAAGPRAEWDEDQRRIAEAHLRIKEWLAASKTLGDLAELVEDVLRRCYLNVVTVTETEMAYRLFNSLNARGKPLTTVDALKSVLFMGLEEDERAELAANWDGARAEAEKKTASGANVTLDALRAAMIARHAPPEAFDGETASRQDLRTIRENPFEWLMANDAERPPTDQIGRELPFYLRVYGRLAEASATPTGGAEMAHFICDSGLELDHWAPVVMAALDPRSGDPDANARKAAAALAFLDIVSARVAWRPAWLTPASVRDRLSAVVPQLRELDVEPLAYRLAALVEEQFDKKMEPHAKLHVGAGGLSGRAARALLTRITAHAELLSRSPQGDYVTYAEQGPAGFALHYLAEKPDRPEANPVAGEEQLAALKDVLGALILVPYGMTSRLATLQFEDKAPLFADARNALSALMSASAPDDPYLRTSLSSLNARLGPYPLGLSAEDVARRQAGYAALANEVWRPTRIMEAAGDPSPRLLRLLGFDRMV